jgi:hypothetical protein
MLDWLIDYLRFYVPLKNFSLIWRRHHCRWRAAKFGPMLGAQGLSAGRDHYRATPAVTWDLGFFRYHPNDRSIQSPLSTHEGMWRIYSNPDPHGVSNAWYCRTGRVNTLQICLDILETGYVWWDPSSKMAGKVRSVLTSRLINRSVVHRWVRLWYHTPPLLVEPMLYIGEVFMINSTAIEKIHPPDCSVLAICKILDNFWEGKNPSPTVLS